MTEVHWRSIAHQLTMKLKYQHIKRQEKVDFVTRDWFKKVWRVDTLCGSMSSLPAMKSLGNQLEAHAACVLLPKESDIDWASTNTSKLTVLKKGFIDGHLAKIQSSDLVLIANYTKNEIKGYIGPNTLMEIAFAYALNKPVVLLFDPGSQSCRLEVLSIADRIIEGNFR
jgi:hypothetical protein